jgi:hypothetical protein
MPDREALEQARADAERVEQAVRESQSQIDAFAQAGVGSFYALAAMRERTVLGLIGDLAVARKKARGLSRERNRSCPRVPLCEPREHAQGSVQRNPLQAADAKRREAVVVLQAPKPPPDTPRTR